MKNLFLIPSLLLSAGVLSLMGETGLVAQSSVQAETTQQTAGPPEQDPQASPQLTKNDPDPGGQSVTYACANREETLSTIAKTPRGRIELVKWQSTFFGDYWTPERRCKAVTQRLQRFADTQQLKYISWGRLNDYKILCISGEEGTCINDGLLLTLEHRDNPVRVLRSLFDYRAPVTRGGKTVIDIDELLQAREPLPEEEATTEPESATPLPSLESKLNQTTLEVAPVFRGE